MYYVYIYNCIYVPIELPVLKSRLSINLQAALR